MGWLIALGILALIAFMPVGALVQYDSRGFLVRIIAGCFRFTLYPMKKRNKKAATESKPVKESKAVKESPQVSKEQKEQTVPQSKSTGQPEPAPKGGNLQDFLPFVRVMLDLMNQFRKKLRVNYLQLKLILAGDDPCDLAVNYGRAWVAMGNLLPLLEKVVTIGKRDCEVECDFTAQQTLVIARMDVTLLVWQAGVLGAVYGYRFLKEFLIFKKKRKGGAVS